MNQRDNSQKMAFLDTNTLHYMGIYLAHSNKYEYPNIYEDKRSDLERRLKANKERENSNDAYIKSVRQGFGVIDFLRAGNIRVEYSPISELELVSGRIKGAAILAAAQESIPDRMWSQFREPEVRERMSIKETQQVSARVNVFLETLKGLEISIGYSDLQKDRDVLRLAKEIVSLVYMAGMDSIIYAWAIFSRADYLITFDESFKEVVDKVHKAADDRYRHIASKLKRCVREVTLVDEEEIVLPHVPDVRWNAS